MYMYVCVCTQTKVRTCVRAFVWHCRQFMGQILRPRHLQETSRCHDIASSSVGYICACCAAADSLAISVSCLFHSSAGNSLSKMTPRHQSAVTGPLVSTVAISGTGQRRQTGLLASWSSRLSSIRLNFGCYSQLPPYTLSGQWLYRSETRELVNGIIETNLHRMSGFAASRHPRANTGHRIRRSVGNRNWGRRTSSLWLSFFLRKFSSRDCCRFRLSGLVSVHYTDSPHLSTLVLLNCGHSTLEKEGEGITKEEYYENTWFRQPPSWYDVYACLCSWTSEHCCRFLLVTKLATEILEWIFCCWLAFAVD